MLIELPFELPERTIKPRENGINMVMDKGLSLREAEDMINTSGHLIDFVKLGFGTSLFTNNLKEKIAFYQKHNIRVYFGGTLFEAFVIRGKYDEYRKFIKSLNINTIEVSDGSMEMNHDTKCEYIRDLAQDNTVISEVGSKEAGIMIAPARWVKMMQSELAAGSVKVIAEARESGTVGIYRPNGSAHVVLINKILAAVPAEKIIWEAPLKSQQVWFIKHFGTNVNLGNIAPNEVIPLETLRMGLRGDTFHQFLPEK
ncbi:MAG: phosphosulfolactate synthase [Bacteroidetes bacterium]|nr:phosphosulfolactate synthase [Bacteroidota bacterium]